VTALRTLLDEPPRPTLVLVDEFARTTSPREGRALLVALIAALGRRGARGLVTTHLTGIASAAAVPHFTAGRLRIPSDLGAGGALPLGAARARLAAALVYGLEPSRGGGDADALALAAALGLDADVIADARRILAEDG
jgi:DNA mismatch repair protein MutS2